METHEGVWPRKERIVSCSQSVPFTLAFKSPSQQYVSHVGMEPELPGC